MEQLSVFDWMPEACPDNLSIEDREILKGSGFAGGKLRICYFFAEPHTEKEKADFLRNEYGEGGWTIPEGHANHGASGIDIDIHKAPQRGVTAIHIGWPMVAKAIDRLIEQGKYKPG